jgi:hypothetical protein|tara:strand:- start:413 stop:532 length:120 start_codon:yes stop_codon:yes gene_type:complete
LELAINRARYIPIQIIAFDKKEFIGDMKKNKSNMGTIFL